MGKSVQWILNVVFLVAIIFLWFKPQSETEDKPLENEIVNQVDSLDDALEIRYVNTDSIWAKYDFVEDMRADLKRRQSEYESDLKQRLSSFEKEVMSFQEKASQMSRFEGEQKQQELIRKEQELGQLQEELSVRLMDMEDKMKRDIRSRILNQLKVYKEDKVDLILDFSTNSSVLMVDDSLDITSDVLNKLNQSYQESKKTK